MFLVFKWLIFRSPLYFLNDKKLWLDLRQDNVIFFQFFRQWSRRIPHWQVLEKEGSFWYQGRWHGKCLFYFSTKVTDAIGIPDMLDLENFISIHISNGLSIQIWDTMVQFLGYLSVISSLIKQCSFNKYLFPICCSLNHCRITIQKLDM